MRADDLLEENRRINVELQRKDEYIRKLEDQLRVKNNAVEVVENLKSCLPVKI